MSTTNLNTTYNNLTTDGLTSLEVDQIVDSSGQIIDTSRLVMYTGANQNLDLGLFGMSSLFINTGQVNFPIFNLGQNEYVIATDSDGAINITNTTTNKTLKYSATGLLTAQNMKLSNLAVAVPTFALGVDAANNVVEFAVPTASNILPLNNTFTGTNTFNNTVASGVGYTTDLNGVIQTKLNSLAYSSASFTTAGITGAYTPPLGTITNVSGSTYQIAQTAQGRSVMAISGFAPSVLTTYVFQINIKCTIGTAILSVEQDNILRSPQYYQLSTSFNTITGTFYYDGNPSTIIFKIYTGVASWNAQWDSFTLSTYSANIVNAPLYAPRITTASSIALTTAGGALTMASNGRVQHASFDNSYTLYGPNSSWGKYLAVGSTPDVGNVNTAQVIGTNGDLFLDAANSKSIYYGNYQTDRGGQGTHTFYGNVYTAHNLNVSAGSVGIGTAGTPTHKLQVVGTVGISGTTTTTGTITCTANGVGFTQLNGTVSVGTYANTTAGWFGTNSNHPLQFYANNSSARMTLNTAGDMTHTAGDSSYMRYGPNGTWNSYLTVGATPDRSGASNAQVITTNGNLHLDGGNSNGMYYGYYANSHGTPNTHEFYGSSINFNSGLPQNSQPYSHVVCLNGTSLQRSQCMMKRLYQNGNVGWGGGINNTYAFYKYNQTAVVRISGKYSGYWTSSYMAYVYVRIYSQSTGGEWGLYLPTFTNNGYNHVTVPFDIIYNGSELPATGWFDLYMANSSGYNTDGNDQMTINVQVLPVDAF